MYAVPGDRIPSQTIGMQLRPEERKAMLELGRLPRDPDPRPCRHRLDGKQRKLDEDLRFPPVKGLVETRHINLRRDGFAPSDRSRAVATLTRDGVRAAERG